MMNAKKCDRCGKFYDIKAKGEDHYCRIDVVGSWGEDYDLCSDCTKALAKWYNCENSDDVLRQMSFVRSEKENSDEELYF